MLFSLVSCDHGRTKTTGTTVSRVRTQARSDSIEGAVDIASRRIGSVGARVSSISRTVEQEISGTRAHAAPPDERGDINYGKLMLFCFDE